MHLEILRIFCNHCTPSDKCFDLVDSRVWRCPEEVENDKVLYNCSLVCKSIRPLALPFMLHCPSLRGSRLPLLVKFLSDNNELSRHVKWLCLDAEQEETIRSPIYLRFDERSLDDVRPGCSELSYKLTGENLAETIADIQIQTLLMTVKDLERLCLIESSGVWDRGLFRHLSSLRGNSCLFPALRSIRIAEDMDSESYSNLGNLTFAIFSVRHLKRRILHWKALSCQIRLSRTAGPDIN
jgi:hypothetical protein